MSHWDGHCIPVTRWTMRPLIVFGCKAVFSLLIANKQRFGPNQVRKTSNHDYVLIYSIVLMLAQRHDQKWSPFSDSIRVNNVRCSWLLGHITAYRLDCWTQTIRLAATPNLNDKLRKTAPGSRDHVLWLSYQIAHTDWPLRKWLVFNSLLIAIDIRG